MPKIIDKILLQEMINTGLSQKEIAKRLDCSTRQIRRICKAGKSNNIINNDNEIYLRNYYSKFETCGQVGRRFGVTRQAINKLQEV
jgi:DNA-binding transcriptional regulator LsrR (DeoR family)